MVLLLLCLLNGAGFAADFLQERFESAAGGEALGVLVLDEQQSFEGGGYRRSGGAGAQRVRRRAADEHDQEHAGRAV